MKYISSSSNKIIKRLTVLQSKSRERKKQQCFVIEGKRELSRALEMGYSLETIFYREDTGIELFDKDFDACYEVSAKLFDRISIRSGSEEVLAIVKTINHDLENLDVNLESKILVLESPEKPGNIGAALRTADAAGVDAVFIADPRTEIYNPNIIRSSLGSIFTIQICLANTIEIINFFKAKKIRIFSTLIEKSIDYKSVNYKEPCAIIIGKESSSISKEWIENSDKLIKIPMKGKMDSLNLSITAAIVIFEASNQRESCES